MPWAGLTARPLYENSDPLRREFPVWGALTFDHGKPEVRSFLIANAIYWIKEFHIDALRVDAVASMLYNDYDRSQWRPNKFGGRMNLESMDFLRQLEGVRRLFPPLDLQPAAL